MKLARVRRMRTHNRNWTAGREVSNKKYLVSTPREWQKFVQKILPHFSPQKRGQ